MHEFPVSLVEFKAVSTSMIHVSVCHVSKWVEISIWISIWNRMAVPNERKPFEENAIDAGNEYVTNVREYCDDSNVARWSENSGYKKKAATWKVKWWERWEKKKLCQEIADCDR